MIGKPIIQMGADRGTEPRQDRRRIVLLPTKREPGRNVLSQTMCAKETIDDSPWDGSVASTLGVGIGHGLL